MKCLTLLLVLLSTVTLAYPSTISAREKDVILVHCDDKNYHGRCDYGRYDRCSPILMVTRSLTVLEGYQCVLYDGPECRVTRVSPHYVGDKNTRRSIADVDFRIMSVICRPAPFLKSARAIAVRSPSTLSARVDKPPVLLVCPYKQFLGTCASGDYNTCTPMNFLVKTLRVLPGHQCAFYLNLDCTGELHYIGDYHVEVANLDVNFLIGSVSCRPIDRSYSHSVSEVHDIESRSNIASRADIDSTVSVNADWSLTICGGKDFQGSCDSGFYESCTGVGAIVQVQSLSVREGIECEFYAESACRSNTGGVVHVGNRQNRVDINSVQFPIRSFKCHHFALHREVNDAVVPKDGQTTEVCPEGEIKCTGNSLRSGVITCEKGAWRAVQACSSHQICVKESVPHCAPR